MGDLPKILYYLNWLDKKNGGFHKLLLYGDCSGHIIYPDDSEDRFSSLEQCLYNLESEYGKVVWITSWIGYDLL